MFKSTVIAVTGLLSLVAAAHAGNVAEHVQLDPTAIIRVGEGCGPDMWRGPRGGCNPFANPYGSHRHTTYECPVGWHFVPGGPGRCFPNR